MVFNIAQGNHLKSKLSFLVTSCILCFSGCFNSSLSKCDSSITKDYLNKSIQEKHANSIVRYMAQVSDLPELASYEKELSILKASRSALEKEIFTAERYDNPLNEALNKSRNALMKKHSDDIQLASKKYDQTLQELRSNHENEVQELVPTFFLGALVANIKSSYERQNQYIKSQNEAIEAQNRYSENKKPFLEYLNYELAIDDLVKNYGEAINRFRPANDEDSYNRFLDNLHKKDLVQNYGKGINGFKLVTDKDSYSRFLDNLFHKRKPQLFTDLNLKTASYLVDEHAMKKLAIEKLKPQFDKKSKELETKYKEESKALDTKFEGELEETNTKYKVELDKSLAPLKEKLKGLDDKIKTLENKQNEAIRRLEKDFIKDIKIDKIVEESLNKDETIRECSASIIYKNFNGKEDSMKSRIHYVVKKSSNDDIVEIKR